MDIASRLEILELEIFQVEEDKLELEQRLGLFWEHPPALDPEAVGRAMQFLRNRIRGLEKQEEGAAPRTPCTNCAGGHPRARAPRRLKESVDSF